MKMRLFSILCLILTVASGWANIIQVAIPGSVWCLVENPLDAAGGNNLINVFGAQLPDGTVLHFWACSDADPVTNTWQFTESGFDAIYDSKGGMDPPALSWWNANFAPLVPPPNLVFVNPSEGVFIFSPVAFVLNFNGNDHVPVLPAALPCQCGHYNLLSPQAIVGAFTLYENVTGLAPAEGAQVLIWNPFSANFARYTYSGGAWSPNTPTFPLGMAAYFLVPCNAGCINFPTPPDLVVSSCSNTPVFYAPTASSTCCGGAVAVVCTPPSGSVFALGTTTPVHCVATDGNGNSASRDFTVTVQGPVLTITPTITITWTGGGVLQEADQLNGPWTDVPSGDVSPCTLPAGAAAKFYRVRCN